MSQKNFIQPADCADENRRNSIRALAHLYGERVFLRGQYEGAYNILATEVSDINIKSGLDYDECAVACKLIGNFLETEQFLEHMPVKYRDKITPLLNALESFFMNIFEREETTGAIITEALDCHGEDHRTDKSFSELFNYLRSMYLADLNKPLQDPKKIDAFHDSHIARLEAELNLKSAQVINIPSTSTAA